MEAQRPWKRPAMVKTDHTSMDWAHSNTGGYFTPACPGTACASVASTVKTGGTNNTVLVYPAITMIQGNNSCKRMAGQRPAQEVLGVAVTILIIEVAAEHVEGDCLM